MDQIGARPGLDFRVDGDRAVHVHELHGPAAASQPLDGFVDVLLSVPGGVDWTGGVAPDANSRDDVARVHWHQRAVYVLGQFSAYGSKARPARTRFGHRADRRME